MANLATEPKHTQWKCLPECNDKKPCGLADCVVIAMRNAKQRGKETYSTRQVGDRGTKEGDHLRADVAHKSPLETINCQGHILPGRTLHLGEFYVVFTGERRSIYTVQEYEEAKVSGSHLQKKYFSYEEALAAYEAFKLCEGQLGSRGVQQGRAESGVPADLMPKRAVTKPAVRSTQAQLPPVPVVPTIPPSSSSSSSSDNAIIGPRSFSDVVKQPAHSGEKRRSIFPPWLPGAGTAGNSKNQLGPKKNRS